MDAVEYLKQRTRMTHKCDIGVCQFCELGVNYNGHTIGCEEFESKFPEEAAAIVENWAKEHPEKTYKDVFLERFPDAKIEKNGVPYPCIIYFFGEKVRPRACGNFSCTYCWDREVEE